MASKVGGNALAGLAIFAVSTVAFAFMFGFGFQGGQDAYGYTRGMMPGEPAGPMSGKAYKAYNTRTVFRR